MTLNDELCNEVLCLIGQLINDCDGSPLPVYGLPAPQREARLRSEAHDYQNQVNYNIADEARLLRPKESGGGGVYDPVAVTTRGQGL